MTQSSPIIDCHVHVARQLTGFWESMCYGLVKDRGRVMQAMPVSFNPSACPPELALATMDEVGVESAFLVQHHLYGNQNAVILEAVQRWPDRFYGFGYLGRMDQPDAPDQLECLIEQGMLGLKVELATTRRLRPSFRFAGEREWRIWERLNALGRPFMIDINGCSSQDVADVDQVIHAFPGMRITICHVGGAPEPGWKERALLAKAPNVWLDLASLQSPFGPEHEYPYLEEQALIEWAATEIGVQKLMWGTDWPGAVRMSTYRQLIDVIRRHCAFLSPADKEAILGGNALRFAGVGA
jgi:L-galactono-1,5-lactonase